MRDHETSVQATHVCLSNAPAFCAIPRSKSVVGVVVVVVVVVVEEGVVVRGCLEGALSVLII